MSFLYDLATYLQTNGVGTLGTNLFYSYMPQSPDSCVAVLDGNGPAPDGYLPTQKPGIQIVVRSVDYETGTTKVDTIRALLQAKTPGFIGSTYVFFMLLTSEDTHLGRDEAGRDAFSMNFNCQTR